MNTQTNQQVVLAFSGGLDTSFCIPYLIEKGYQVTTIFVDSGGVTEKEKVQMKADGLDFSSFNHCVYLRGFDIETKELIGHNCYGDFR